MEVNFEELEKQRKESILKSGEYCGTEILIGKQDKMPIVNVYLSKVSPYEVAMFITTLKKTAESLEERYPLAREVAKHMATEIYEIDGNEGK